MATGLTVDPLTASCWRAEAAARGLTVQEFLAEAVDQLIADADQPDERDAGAQPVLSRTNW